MPWLALMTISTGGIGVKMADLPVVVVDADGIVGLVSEPDYLHEEAVQVFSDLAARRAQFIYPSTALLEAVTHIQRVLSDGRLAYETGIKFTAPGINILAVEQDLMVRALSFFSPSASKKNTLYDCVVAAVAEKFQADAIFSFDKFYKSMGFKLASEL